MSDSMTVFDRTLLRRRRDRAAPGLDAHDFLFRDVAERLADRLEDVRRDFPFALDVGCHGGEMARALAGRRDIGGLVQCDLSPAMARRARDATGHPSVAADEELLPFAPGRFDLVTSCLSLHWVNDLPGALIQIRRLLRPDGLFVAALFGGDTLFELRSSLQEAEASVYGGLSPRVSPFADVRDAGGLMQRAGFALPVVDSDTLTVTYSDPLRLLADLRGMGETNAVLERRRVPARRELFAEALGRYAQAFAEPDGSVTATFQVIWLTGWAPHESQQQPRRPGTATTRLADALKVEEKGAGDAVPRPRRPR